MCLVLILRWAHYIWWKPFIVHVIQGLSILIASVVFSRIPMYWPAWCWRCVDCTPPRYICCKLGPEMWRRGRGNSPGWLLRGVKIYINNKYITCHVCSTYSCAPRRWSGRRCRTHASRQGRRPCGAEAPASAQGSRHTRSSRGPGLGGVKIKYSRKYFRIRQKIKKWNG